MIRIALHTKVGVIGLVYRKSLRLSAAARQDRTLGEIVNLMQLDSQKIEGFMNMVHNLWDGLYQICGYLAILTARHDSAEDFSRLNALLCTAMAWIFIPAYCFAVP